MPKLMWKPFKNLTSNFVNSSALSLEKIIAIVGLKFQKSF